MNAWGLFLLVFLFFFYLRTDAHASSSDQEIDKIKVTETTRISVVFSSQNNHQPESAFGHVFLLFHQEIQPEPDALAVEFVGHVASFSEMIRSVGSEVEGRYRVVEFSQKSLEYDLEDRDLFIFELRVSAVEIKQLADNVSVELKKSYPYSFIKKNCGFYLNRLLHKNGLSIHDLSSDTVVKPIDVINSLDPSRIIQVKLAPSSRHTAIYYRGKLTADEELIFNRFLLGYDVAQEVMSNSLKAAVSSQIRYQLPREDEAWLRQHMAQQQKNVWHVVPLDFQKKYDDESKGHYIFAIQKKRIESIRFQKELRNFSTQHADDSSSSYLDVFSTELTLKDDRLQVSEFSVIKSEAIQPSMKKARLLELSYRNWDRKTDAGEKELYASLGVGAAYEVPYVRFGFIPNLTLAYTNQEKNQTNARLGYRAISELRISVYGIRFSIDQWQSSPFSFSKDLNLQLRMELNSKSNLGFELNRIPEINKVNQRLLLTYSL
jgi:Domain of unknown function (DUF4105)